MDIKKKIDEIVKKLKSDKNLMKKFKDDPVSAVESLIGVDLPNDQIEKIIDGIKAKITVDKAGSFLGKLFKKK